MVLSLLSSLGTGLFGGRGVQIFFQSIFLA
jgi:hypothetical protein